ncbi:MULTISPECIES: M48 family metallopeptidase [Nocardiopsis]|uniref:Peptidase M48 Ste24p n=1 Tax=Nocardiopsis dassonvillei (strain ATCC 23218 / DSM 43111 / CIP 107115 / JCM 7437 / KCTC 9190 / NBRC 14626 / NCTC 10488 / NRRL B-5397 / IMRU 509) TaxID=446468 RepID=D7AV77_NOCDD|nr:MULTISPECIES: M48 family metallopeptidase [Nocardiopsis]ADH65738.1 peptidase M48 Ste24p [Nocardiopsis dassonvillei subsp. dassonvillei DSM 43111]APC34082.1 peptidase M48 family protein [Nocardiopsis dassonvillei]NKY80999.1 M48 family metallopeptidase [Nocardiopsis dassonvillei]VEI91758.1 heat shock protein HtpX [Nocardiopsis dassonvillei]
MAERRLRHPREIPLLVVCVGVTLLAVVGAVSRAYSGEPNQPLLLLSIPALVYFVRGQQYARQRVNGVRITENQFPEAHRMVTEAAAAFRMKKVPEAYVVLGNGELNAFASGHGFRRYVAVTSDLFEVGDRLADADTLRFVIGHEVGHIAAGHTSFWRQFGISVANVIPGVGTSLNRAQEYTADNHAHAFCPEGMQGLRVLAAGKYLYPAVDFHDIAARARTDTGFFVLLVNLLSSHPVNTFRFAALADRTRPGRVF